MDRYYGFFNQAGVTNADVDAYFTRSAFDSMFGDDAADITDEDIAAAAEAARDVSIPGVYLAISGTTARRTHPVLLTHEHGAGAAYARYADDEEEACARAQAEYRNDGQSGKDAAVILEYFLIDPLPTLYEVKGRFFRCFASADEAVTWAQQCASVGLEFLPCTPGETLEWFSFMLSQIDALREQGEWVEPE